MLDSESGVAPGGGRDAPTGLLRQLQTGGALRTRLQRKLAIGGCVPSAADARSLSNRGA